MIINAAVAGSWRYRRRPHVLSHRLLLQVQLSTVDTYHYVQMKVWYKGKDCSNKHGGEAEDPPKPAQIILLFCPLRYFIA